jgi:hypothetical protein
MLTSPTPLELFREYYNCFLIRMIKSRLFIFLIFQYPYLIIRKFSYRYIWIELISFIYLLFTQVFLLNCDLIHNVKKNSSYKSHGIFFDKHSPPT